MENFGVRTEKISVSAGNQTRDLRLLSRARNPYATTAASGKTNDNVSKVLGGFFASQQITFVPV